MLIGLVFYLLYNKWEAGFGIGMVLIMVFNIVFGLNIIKSIYYINTFGLSLGPVVWLYIPEIA